MKMNIPMLTIMLCCNVIPLFSCSTAPVKWYRAGTSQATFIKDKTACEEGLLAIGDNQVSQQTYSFEGCMEAKGYTVIPASSE